MNPLISKVIEEKKDEYIIQGNVLFQITTSENQNNNTYTNVSSIILGECETILKRIYGIDDNDPLIIFKVDYNITGLLIPIIGYEIYDPVNKTKLNLSHCNKSTINYNIPVTIDEDNLYKYDPNSEYYTDECSTYTSEDGTDILLSDRKEEFNDNNMSLCENKCDFIKYDSDTKKAICECGIKYEEYNLSDLDNKTDLLSINFTSDNSTSTISAMKCVDLLFSKEGLLTNIGNYIMLFIIILHAISVVIFYKCGYQIIANNIQEILKEKKKAKKSKSKIKPRKSDKNNIYNLEKIPDKIKRKSSYKCSLRSEKSKIQKSKKKEANPTKKYKRKSSRIIIQQEKMNMSNNQKSITKLTLKETKIIPQYSKKQKNFSFGKEKKKKEVELKDINSNILVFSDIELNYMDYNDALTFDKRNYQQYYISLIKIKHHLFFIFCFSKDYNVFIIKICLCFLFFSIYYAINALFFTNSIIHKVYKNRGRYSISIFFTQIFLSFIIAYHISALIKYFTLSERNLLEIKKQKTLELANLKKPNIERIIIIKNICYFIISIIFLLFFWYYLSSFGALYQNSQVHLIKNTFISYLFGIVYPFLINLLTMMIRKFSLNRNNREFSYKISKILQIL